jgi:hypothetical protein
MRPRIPHHGVGQVFAHGEMHVQSVIGLVPFRDPQVRELSADYPPQPPKEGTDVISHLPRIMLTFPTVGRVP